MSSQILEKLKQFPLFKNVPDDRLEQVAQKTLIHEFNRQDYIWNEADISRHLYIIVSGRVKILKHSETGKDVIVEIYGPGEAIGEMSLLVGGTYTTAAVCLSRTRGRVQAGRALARWTERGFNKPGVGESKMIGGTSRRWRDVDLYAAHENHCTRRRQRRRG